MSNTIVRKFCTLREAAQRLDATEDQIENLLRKGLLREFREGSHRLLRTADVGAIVAARNRRLERQGQPLPHRTARPLAGEVNDRPPAGPVGTVRLPRAASAAPETPHRNPARPKTTAGRRQPNDLGSRDSSRRRVSTRSPELPPLSDSLRATRSRTEPLALPARHRSSIREWFWTGLIQDRPETIFVLSGLVLLVVAGVVAGVCALAGRL